MTPPSNAARQRPILPLVVLPLVVLVLAGCAAQGPKIFTNKDPTANFATFHTFGYEEPLGTDRPEYSSLLSQYLKAAVTREMESRGYRYSDNPDLMINFYVATKEKFTTTTTAAGPAYPGYYGYRGGYYGVWSGYETTTSQHTEGTLNVDLVDPKRKQLVWEATAEGKVKDEYRANLQPVIDEVISQIFRQYPYTAP